jgi:putative membrane protein insertion efficiency factor
MDMMKIILIKLIRLYQKHISPNIPNTCKFRPTCSEYAIEVIKKYGVLKGILKSIIRLSRCNPYFEGGYDPVK